VQKGQQDVCNFCGLYQPLLLEMMPFGDDALMKVSAVSEKNGAALLLVTTKYSCIIFPPFLIAYTYICKFVCKLYFEVQRLNSV